MFQVLRVILIGVGMKARISKVLLIIVLYFNVSKFGTFCVYSLKIDLHTSSFFFLMQTHFFFFCHLALEFTS